MIPCLGVGRRRSRSTSGTAASLTRSTPHRSALSASPVAPAAAISLRPARAGWSFVKPSVIPGFGLTFGYTLLYLSLIVLIPIIGLFLKAATISPEQIW